MKQEGYSKRRERQYIDSARITGYTIVLATASIVGLIIYNVIVHGF